MTKNKKFFYIGIGLIILGLIIGRWYLINKNKSKIDNSNKNESLKTENNQTKIGILTEPEISDQGIYVLNYKWKVEALNIPEKLSVYQKQDALFNDQTINKFITYLGFKGEPVKNDKNIIAFVNKDEATTLYVNKADNFVNYHRNLTNKPINPSETRLNDTELLSNLTKVINSVVNLPDKMSLELENIERQEDRMVYFEMDYKWDNRLLFTNLGPPIKARFYDDGTLLNFSINLPILISDNKQDLTVKNFDEIKKLPGSSFKVLAIKGGEGTQLYDEDPQVIIDDITINQAGLGYISQYGNNELQPYLIFVGGGKVKNKEVILKLGVPALKENVYK